MSDTVKTFIAKEARYLARNASLSRRGVRPTPVVV